MQRIHITSSQHEWSRRSFLEGVLCTGAILPTAKLTNEVVCAHQSRLRGADFTNLSIREVSDLVRRKVISPVELTRASLQRIERLNPALNCFITVTAERAMADAHSAESEIQRGKWRGPLHGIPIGIKDNIDIAGVRTTFASAVFKDHIPVTDSEVVRRLKIAGAILLGKQNLDEVAFGTTATASHFGAVHNPWQLDHIAGGSSGGSSAAVAAGLGFGAVGTDAGGSIRVPSAYCGIAGLKPTYGLVSMRGAGDSGWWSMNHVGPMCRNVADTALLLSVIAGHDPRDTSSVDVPIPDYAAALRSRVSTLRLGIPRSGFYDKLDPAIELAIGNALKVLHRLTADVREVSLEPISNTTAPNIILAENYAFHAASFLRTPELYKPSIRRNLQEGSKVTAADYIRSRREVDALRRVVGNVFSNVDLLVTPTTAVPPPTIEDAIRRGLELELEMIRNTTPFNVYGLPTISIPCGFTSSGMPIGMQITGPRFGERRVLALAHAYEQTTDWHKRHPNL